MSKACHFTLMAGFFSATFTAASYVTDATSINGVKTMLKKTLTAAITAAVLLSAGAAMAAPDANWAFSKEAIEVLKTKNGYITIKKIELENPATGIWKAEGVKKIDGVEVEVETTFDHNGTIIKEKKD
ncbi:MULTISPECIES: PepSY domain-containing protein [unclassified Pseudomonas]|nr:MULTISPECIES: PepSY domain-containing protein [unclassified Pseudomonas]